ncbi:cystathionine beta-lyase [Obelidium mucronatum]|nr:cystathionine beta-lyase [Obelidium mucronatum]
MSSPVVSSVTSASSSAAVSTSKAGGKDPQDFKLATRCVVVANPGDPYNASSVPIYQTATFKQTSASEMGAFDYTRSGNPTRSVLETHLEKLMRCERAFVTTTGMSALDAILRLVRSGDEIIAGDDLYGGLFLTLQAYLVICLAHTTYTTLFAITKHSRILLGTNRLLTYIKTTLDITVHHVDTTSVEAVRNAINPAKTKFVLLESPTNPMMKIADIPTISALVHEACPDALVIVDNTMMSPILMNCLELGADIEYHSGTKYLSGHHDLMAGVIGVKDAQVANRIYFIINSIGCGLAPFDSFLLLRGLKTLALRLERQQQNAENVAVFLEQLGYSVSYPGLDSHPQKKLHMSMASGAGAVLSFVTGDVEKSTRIVEACQLWGISVSFGCVNSLISMPCNMSHASIPAEVRKARALPDDLIRLCVGIEDIEDLLNDLKSAIDIAESTNDLKASVISSTSEATLSLE